MQVRPDARAGSRRRERQPGFPGGQTSPRRAWWQAWKPALWTVASRAPWRPGWVVLPRVRRGSARSLGTWNLGQINGGRNPKPSVCGRTAPRGCWSPAQRAGGRTPRAARLAGRARGWLFRTAEPWTLRGQNGNPASLAPW